MFHRAPVVVEAERSIVWEERARESSAYNLEQIRQYLAKHRRPAELTRRRRRFPPYR